MNPKQLCSTAEWSAPKQNKKRINQMWGGSACEAAAGTGLKRRSWGAGKVQLARGMFLSDEEAVGEEILALC